MRTTLPFAILAAAGAVGCSSTHPLDRDGAVEVFSDSAGPLFASSRADAAGPHQRSSQNLTVSLTEAGQPAKNAFVDVQVLPSTALTLRATDGSCADDGGFFRCTGSEQGIAHFAVDADTQWSSATPAVVRVIWSDKNFDLPVSVLPPGLPKTATSFTLSVGGLASGQQQRVPPTFSLLSCTAQPLDPGAAWPAAPRQRKVFVYANAPPGDPTSVAYAPVVLGSPSTEVEFSTGADCKSRSANLVITLDPSGAASAFACFSAVGGVLAITASSGELGITDSSRRELQVDPEPRFLGVTAVNQEAHVSQPLSLFQIVARDVLGQRVAMSVTVSASGTGALQFGQSSYSLNDESVSQPTVVDVTPTAPGTVHLHVAPDLVPSLGCDSPDIEILP